MRDGVRELAFETPSALAAVDPFPVEWCRTLSHFTMMPLASNSPPPQASTRRRRDRLPAMSRVLAAWRSLAPRTQWSLLVVSLLLLVALSSGVGIHNGFTYDDVEVIQHNAEVHTLRHWWTLFAQSYWPRAYGGDGYRPLTMLVFAAQWVIGHGAPWLFHATNIVLYGAVTIAVFWFASLLLPTAAAWLVAALFAVHPVHVEAVASTVGQSELWVALLLVPAMAIYLRRCLTGTALTHGEGALICACYTLGLFAKEHAIVLPALIIAAEVLLGADRRRLAQRLVAIRPLILCLTLLAALYLAARSAVKGGDISGFQPFVVFQTLDLSYANRVLTMIGVVPQWIRLLFWPARLTTEYAPPDIDIAQGASVVQLPGLLLLVGILGLAVVLWKRRGLGAIASFGIAWFCITLLPSSNFVIPAGIIIAERTLFLPSLGALLVIGAIAVWITQRIEAARSFALRRNLSMLSCASVAIILLAASARSASRTVIWHDNDRLFTQGIIDAPQSYRAYYMFGARKFEEGDARAGERTYRLALKLFPYDPYMAYNFAFQYQVRGAYEAAIPLYKWAFALDPRFRGGQGRGNLALCYANANHPAEAREQALLAMSMGGAPLWQLRRILQYSDSVLGRTDATRRSNSLRADQLAALAGNSPLQSQNTTMPPGLAVSSAMLTGPPIRH